MPSKTPKLQKATCSSPARRSRRRRPRSTTRRSTWATPTIYAPVTGLNWFSQLRRRQRRRRAGHASARHDHVDRSDQGQLRIGRTNVSGLSRATEEPRAANRCAIKTCKSCSQTTPRIRISGRVYAYQSHRRSRRPERSPSKHGSPIPTGCYAPAVSHESASSSNGGATPCSFRKPRSRSRRASNSLRHRF